MAALATNKRASFDYDILETYQAGLVLLGGEVKSVKKGDLSLQGAYITWRTNKGKSLPEPYLVNAYIAPYKPSGKFLNYTPERERKLLLNKAELKHLIGKKQTPGLTLIPLKIYTKLGFIKLELALAKGKKKFDKREDIKKKDIEKRLRTLTKKAR